MKEYVALKIAVEYAMKHNKEVREFLRQWVLGKEH